MNLLRTGSMLAIGWAVLFFHGCASPDGRGGENTMNPDKDPFRSSISSGDIRTVASQMAPSLLSVPEIATADTVKRIKFGPFKNTTRFFIKQDIMLRRLSAELNRYGNGKIRFLSDASGVMSGRKEILKERQSMMIQRGMQQIASEIAALPVVQKSDSIKVAVLPGLNVNLVNMNGESFIAMLRSEISSASKGKVQFLLPNEIKGADYYLAGQFIPETVKTEGIINLANYIEVVDARVKSGQSMYITSELENEVYPMQITTVQHNENVSSTTITPPIEQQKIALYETHIKELLNNPELRQVPDVNMRLNVILAEASSKASVYEKMLLVERKVASSNSFADYIISGEITGMEQRNTDDGKATDYLLITMQLTDVETGEIVWEDFYEVKRFSASNVEYR